jgi:hypothetical protein
MMELNLQFGWGMMDHCRALIERWQGGNVILSPRDLTAEQLERLATSVNKLPGGEVWLDPQFYLPHSDHERLCSHSYWPADFETGIFFQGQALSRLINQLTTLNNLLNTSAFVLPGLLATRLDDDWFLAQEATLEEAAAREQHKPLVATVALSDEIVLKEDDVASLIERAEAWKTNHVYLVCQHPKGDYLVENPNWLANVIDLAAGFRLSGKYVTLGYCSHQMLIASLAKVRAIASGTWMNVRSFPPDKFVVAYEDEIKQRSTWYYCPQSLSEYKIPFLDIAQRLKLLQRMAPTQALNGGYAGTLFAGDQPSASGFNEQLAFRHYLYALRGQTMETVKPSFDETVDHHRTLLDDAESLLQVLHGSGIRGQKRDFREIIDVNRAALELFTTLRGPILRRKWDSL